MALKTTFVLWGSHPSYASGLRIKLVFGTVRQCRAELARRKAEGWTDLGILAA